MVQPQMSLSVGTKVGHYQISSLLGAGGMGEVYLAQDINLRRPVALKLLPADFLLNKDRLIRFEQEAQAASALNHPNILTIYEIGEIDKLRFIATEFIDGLTLRQQMKATMELSDVVDAGIQIASALAAAHQAGIVHRDIKPENIMVRRDGYVKVLDFGLAKLNEADSSSSGPEDDTMHAVRTEPGVLMGTIDYMSPEQVRGLEVDERTDIWGLGVVLYEMLTGTKPFKGATRSDVIAAILKTEPMPLSYYQPNLPSDLQAIVRKSLRKRQNERYQTITALVEDLKNLRREIEISGRTDRPFQPPPSSVAILPFQNLTKDPTVGFYEFALADAVITELVRLRSLVVRPSSAIARYLGQAKDPIEAGNELKVNAVLAASFLHTGTFVRVTAQLLDVASGELLWGDRIDSDASDIITVQDIIAQRIVKGLNLRLSSDEEIDLAGHATANALAYEEYLRGRDRVGRYIYHTVANDDIEAAIAHFLRAIELDPNFALAHCALGSCYMQRNLKGAGSVDDLRLAQESLEAGLELDPKIVDARAYMVFFDVLRGRKDLARERIAGLRREAPNWASVHFVSAVLSRLDGRYDAAIRSFERMLRLNPSERIVATWCIARIHMYQGRFDLALADFDRVSVAEQNHPLAKAYRAQVLFYLGHSEAAADILTSVLTDNPELNAIRPLLAIALSAQGKHAEARAQLTERVKEVAALDWDGPYWVASAYAMEGEPDEAFKWLDKAISAGNENLPWFESNPIWQPLRSDERFEQLMQRIRRLKRIGAAV
jgi:serine/threonine-protein kinase